MAKKADVLPVEIHDSGLEELIGQKTKAQSLPVVLPSDMGDLPITLAGETVDVGDRAARDLGKVDVAGIDAIGTVAGQKTKAASFPVVLPSDQGDLPITLDGEVVVLGAGTAAIGKLAANSGVDIGDVDVTSLPAAVLAGMATLPAGTNNIGKIDPVTSTPTVYNLTLTLADTEYSQALPTNCRGFEFQARTDAALRYAFVTGKVAGPTAPYLTLKAGDYYFSPAINQAASPSTLFFAAAVGGIVVEIIAWT